MKPADVPEELVKAAVLAYWPGGSERLDDALWTYGWQQRRILAVVLPAHEALVREQVAAERDARKANPPLVVFGAPCVECGETFEEGDRVTWRWNYQPYGLIHDECRRDGDKPALTEAEIRADERRRIAEELRADADAHRRLVARAPSEHDAARLERARVLDEAAGRITRGGQ